MACHTSLPHHPPSPSIQDAELTAYDQACHHVKEKHSHQEAHVTYYFLFRQQKQALTILVDVTWVSHQHFFSLSLTMVLPFLRFRVGEAMGATPCHHPLSPMPALDGGVFPFKLIAVSSQHGHCYQFCLRPRAPSMIYRTLLH